MIDKVLLMFLIFAATWTVMTTRLLRSVIGLAVTSVILTVILFRLNAPLAAVFELSVCAGLIPVIFITAIGFTERLTPEKLIARKKERLSKYWYLPVLLILAGICLSCLHPSFDFKTPAPALENDVRKILWGARPLDLLGQIAILLVGAFGVVVLFKEKK